MRKLLFLGLLFAALAVAIAVAIYVYSSRPVEKKVNITVAEVQKDLREHLIVGASRSQVESYLDERHIPHSYIDHSAVAPEYSHTESALIRDSSETWLIRGDIQILFKFDKKEKLIDYSVKEGFTGP